MNVLRSLKLMACGFGLAIVSQFAMAQSYPARPIRMVMPFAAGSPTDALARVFAMALGARLGQTVIVDNKPGASGIIGTETVAKAPADGYTLLFTSHTTQAANPAMFKKLPYDPGKDFSAISIIGGVPHVLVVHPSLPVNSVSELVTYAKAHQGVISFPYANSTTRVTASTFRTMTNTNLLGVPYKTYPQAVSELLAGQTQMMFIEFATGLQHIRSGKLRALGVTPERSAKLPGVPAMSEALPGFSIGNWAGLFAPAGTPAEIVNRLNREVNALMASPEIQKQVDGIGYELHKPMTPAEFSRFVAAEQSHWAQLIKSAGIEPE